MHSSGSLAVQTPVNLSGEWYRNPRAGAKPEWFYAVPTALLASAEGYSAARDRAAMRELNTINVNFLRPQILPRRSMADESACQGYQRAQEVTL